MKSLSWLTPDRTLLASFAFACAAMLASAGARGDETVSSVGIRLRLLDAGRFERGESDLAPGFDKDHTRFPIDDVHPVHPVVLTRPFYLATTEVTVGQFRRFIQETGYRTSAETNQRGAVGWDPRPPADNPRYVATFRDGGGFHWKNPGFEQADDHPVVGVSFVDAKEFCAWLSSKDGVKYRLPTDAEWEYAARAGTETYFSFGNEYRGTIQRHANIGNVELERAFPDRARRQWLVDIDRDPADPHVFTAPVGSYLPNPWDLHDMYGNVWEWCEDRYLDTAYAPYTRPGYQQVRRRAIDPLNMEKWSQDGDWRVIRGGSWFNAPIQCRSSVRGYFEAADSACYVGFRIARDASADVAAIARRRFDRSEAARTTLQRLADQVRERRDGRLTIELSQQRQRLTDEFLAALQGLDEPVDLHIGGRGELTAAHLAALLKTPQLRGLVLSDLGPHLNDADFASLANHPQLELLHLGGAPNLSNALLPHLSTLEKLELLHLEGTTITDEGLLLPPLKRLKTLELSGTMSRGLVLARIRGSSLNRLSCDHLSDEAAEILAEFPTVRELAIGRSPITGRGLAAIARLPRLQSLNLSGCRELADADFEILGSAYSLSSLHLTQTAAGDLAAAGLTRLNNLQDLQLGSDRLTDQGMQRICELVSLRFLTISADAVHLTDRGLTDLWRLINLHSLALSAPRVTGSGLEGLEELPRLEWLNLDGAGIGDAALKHAAESESLRQLSVGSRRHGGPAALTDAGLLHLTKARGLTRFELVRRGTGVTDEGAATLRNRRPDMSANIHAP